MEGVASGIPEAMRARLCPFPTPLHRRGGTFSPLLWVIPICLLALLAFLTASQIHPSLALRSTPFTSQDASDASLRRGSSTEAKSSDSSTDPRFHQYNFTYAASQVSRGPSFHDSRPLRSSPAESAQGEKAELTSWNDESQIDSPVPPCGPPCLKLERNPCLGAKGKSPNEREDFVIWGEDGEGGEAAAGGEEKSVEEDKDGLVEGARRPWHWSSRARECGFKYLTHSRAASLFYQKRIIFAGDSQVRKVLLALMRLLVPGSNITIPKRTSVTFQIPHLDTRIDYLFAPYPVNASLALEKLSLGGECPDVLVLGAGLWHMLWINSPELYEYGMRSLRVALVRFLHSDACASRRDGVRGGAGVSGTGGLPLFFWVGFPKLLVSRLNTERKQALMGFPCQDAYHIASQNSRLVVGDMYEANSSLSSTTPCPESGELTPTRIAAELGSGMTQNALSGVFEASSGPALDVQLLQLSHACTGLCAMDGMHYNDSLYDAAVQIMINLEQTAKQSTS